MINAVVYVAAKGDGFVVASHGFCQASIGSVTTPSLNVPVISPELRSIIETSCNVVREGRSIVAFKTGSLVGDASNCPVKFQVEPDNISFPETAPMMVDVMDRLPPSLWVSTASESTSPLNVPQARAGSGCRRTSTFSGMVLEGTLAVMVK